MDTYNQLTTGFKESIDGHSELEIFDKSTVVDHAAADDLKVS